MTTEEMRRENYGFLRANRPDVLEMCVKIGLAAHLTTGDSLHKAAAAESCAVELAVKLLKEK